MKDFDRIEHQTCTRHDVRESKKLPRIAACTRAYVVFDWMANLAIDAAGGKDKVFGTKPGVADYTPTDLTTEAGRAAKGNLANYGDIAAFLEKILPGYSEMVKTGSKNALSMLRGEIPKDVQDYLRRSTAFKSMQGGYAGSGMSKALTARDFGKTSLDLMERGENSAARWAGLTQASVAPFTVTASAQAGQTERNNIAKQNTEQFKFNVAAAPDPGAAGLFNTIATIGGTAASFGMGAMTGGMGGGQQQQRPQQQQNQNPYFNGTAANTGTGAGGWTWGSYNTGG